MTNVKGEYLRIVFIYLFYSIMYQALSLSHNCIFELKTCSIFISAQISLNAT